MYKAPALQSIVVLVSLAIVSCGGGNSNNVVPPTSPPFAGTIFVGPDIITPDDPSAFESITANGTGQRLMYDRRPDSFITLTPYLFNAQYYDGLSIEIQINPEFDASEVGELAETYARYFGQLPTLLRRDVETSWIHKGVKPYGGGNENILIHIGQSEQYLLEGILEETLVHEASHTSLDSYYAASDEWLAAQRADPTFISDYAMEFAQREDIAESFLLYLGLRYRRDRISDDLAATIEASIPNRIQFFDTIAKDMYPLE